MAGTPQTVTVTGNLPLASADQAVFTDTITNSNPFGFSTKAKGDALIAEVNALRATLVAAGFIVGGSTY